MSKSKVVGAEKVSDIEGDVFIPRSPYGAYAKSGDEISELRRRMMLRGAARKHRPVTLPSIPFDWKSDPVTSAPDPQAPDVSAAVAVPSSTAPAAAANQFKSER